MTQDLHTLTGPYALDALPADEAAEFELHLDQCAACRAELLEFRATAAQLGEATAMSPPASMKNAVMAEITATRQDTPKVVSLADRRPVMRKFALQAVAAITIIAMGLGLALASLTTRVNELEGREQAIASMLAASDVQFARAEADGIMALVLASPGRGEAVVSFANLDRAPTDHQYALWMIGPDGPIPAGLFDSDADGKAIAFMSGDVSTTQSIAVTIEPTGGSAQPTTTPFINVTLVA